MVNFLIDHTFIQYLIECLLFCSFFIYCCCCKIPAFWEVEIQIRLSLTCVLCSAPDRAASSLWSNCRFKMWRPAFWHPVGRQATMVGEKRSQCVFYAIMSASDVFFRDLKSHASQTRSYSFGKNIIIIIIILSTNDNIT